MTDRVAKRLTISGKGPDHAAVKDIVIEEAKGFVPARFEIKPTV